MHEHKSVIDVEHVSVTYRVRRARGIFRREPMRKSRSRIEAIRDVSFSCFEGETLGIIGPNGAGKSTLCLALAGILSPDSGVIRTHGSVSCLLAIGRGFALSLTGRQNIFINGALLGLTRSDVAQRIDDIIEFSGLDQAIDDPVSTYSSGMRSRLSFSIATSIEPEVLLLDEALGAGDRLFRARIKTRMESLMQRARSIVLVSHSLNLVRSTCSRVIWLQSGRIRMTGNPGEVVDAYERGDADAG